MSAISPSPFEQGLAAHEQPTTPIEEPFEVVTDGGETVVVTPLDIAKAVETELLSAPNDTARDHMYRIPILRRLTLAMSALSEEDREQISHEARVQASAFSLRLAKAAKSAGRTSIR
jgi:hypothetical protein